MDVSDPGERLAVFKKLKEAERREEGRPRVARGAQRVDYFRGRVYVCVCVCVYVYVCLKVISIYVYIDSVTSTGSASLQNGPPVLSTAVAYWLVIHTISYYVCHATKPSNIVLRLYVYI